MLVVVIMVLIIGGNCPLISLISANKKSEMTKIKLNMTKIKILTKKVEKSKKIRKFDYFYKRFE